MSDKGAIVPRSLSEAAEYVLTRMREFGFPVSAGSRLERMHRIVFAGNSSQNIIPVDHPEFEVAAEAIRDVRILEFILETAPNPAPQGFMSLLHKVGKDPILPQDSPPESEGRDAQAELHVAAICRKAGMEPVEHAEPDVRCVVGNQPFGIAVKRIKNVKRLEERVRGAAKQIERSNLPGIITLDVSLALNPENKRVRRPMADETFRNLYYAAIHKFIELHHDNLQEWVRRRGVRGIVFHNHQVRLAADGHWWLESMTCRLCTARMNQRRNREFAVFEAQYERGLPNLIRLGI